MLNRPYIWTFNKEFERAAYNEEALKQIFKLVRNFVSSLYLGSGVPRAELEFEEGPSNKEAYLEWVRQWKINYANLSQLIRFMRQCRRTMYYDARTLQDMLPSARNKYRNPDLRIDQLRVIIERMYLKYEDQLKEAAQVMINARHNAKLASVGSREAMRSDSNRKDAGSSPARRTNLMEKI